MISPEELTGDDLLAIRKELGRPWSQAMQENDEVALYAFVWRSRCRERDGLKFADVLALSLEEIMAEWGEATEAAADPTPAGSGTISPGSATSGG